MAFAWSGESTQGARLRVERRLQQHRGRGARCAAPPPRLAPTPAGCSRPRVLTASPCPRARRRTTGCARPSASTSRRSSTCSTRGAGSSTSSSTASRRTTSRRTTRRRHRHRRGRRRALAPPRPRPLGPLGLCATRATSCCGLYSCVCVCVRVLSVSLAAVGACLSCLSTCEFVTVCLSLSSSHLAIGQHCTNSDRPSQWLPTGSPGEPSPQKQGLGGVRGGLALEGPPRELQPLLPGSAFY